MVVLALVITGFVAPGFFNKKVFDNGKMASSIQNSDQGKTAGLSDVSCPKDKKVKKGEEFDCSAGDGKKIHVKVTSSDGDYDWAISDS